MRRVLYRRQIKPAPRVTRAELAAVVSRATPTNEFIDQHEAYMAVFDANAPLDGASNLIFSPDYETEINTWAEGGRWASTNPPQSSSSSGVSCRRGQPRFTREDRTRTATRDTRRSPPVVENEPSNVVVNYIASPNAIFYKPEATQKSGDHNPAAQFVKILPLADRDKARFLNPIEIETTGG